MTRGLEDDLRQLQDCLERLRAACRQLEKGERPAVLAVARHHLAELRALAARIEQRLTGAAAAPVPQACPACGQSWWRYRSDGMPRWECGSCGWSAVDTA